VCLLGVIRGKENPVVGRAFSSMRQIIVKTRNQQLESQVHPAIILIYFYERYGSFKIFLVAVDRNIALAIVRNTETGISNYIFSIFSTERRSVIAANIRQLDDFHSFKGG